MAAAGAERGWATLEGLVARALEPVLRRWLRNFRRDQLRLDGLACQLFGLELNAAVRARLRAGVAAATQDAAQLAARPAASRGPRHGALHRVVPRRGYAARAARGGVHARCLGAPGWGLQHDD